MAQGEKQGMKLYHFTSKHHVDGCLKEGIKLGGVPVIIDGKYQIISGYQWLTSNPSFHQEWANREFTTLSYDRTEYRLTVIIPKTSLNKLIKWSEYYKYSQVPEELNYYGDPENWYLFQGRIKPGWIREIENKAREEVK